MRAAVMGILNVTPDSFSDGGEYVDVDVAAARAMAMVADGATFVDVGGESTRPGAAPVSIDEEIARVVPVIERIVRPVTAAGAVVSVDTRHAAVAEAAVRVGASVVNDVSASLEDVAAELGVGWVAMHMAGEPADMQDDPQYDDVVGEVAAFLAERLRRGRAAGVRETWLDPGIGFGKTFVHNWELLAGLDAIVGLGAPVLVGTSRKGFLGAVLGASDDPARGSPAPADDRLAGSIATATWAAALGAAVLRCHDVRATAAAVAVVGDARPDLFLAPEVG